MVLLQLCLPFSLMFCFMMLRLCESSASSRADLYDYIRNRSKPELIPIENDDHTMMVRVSVYLLGVNTLNQIEEYISVYLFLRMSWRNELTTWDPAQFGNLTSIHVPLTGFWTPDIMPLYTRGHVPNMRQWNAEFMIIQHTGDTIWVPGGHVSSYCPIDARHFPFDVQTCTLQFGSSNFDSRMLNFSLNEDAMLNESTLSFYTTNSEWKIEGTSSKISTETKADDLTFSWILYTIRLERRPLIIVTTTILPLLVLAMLNVCLFKIQPETTDKVRSHLIILLSFSVFHSYFSATFPMNGERVPYLTIYIICIFVMTASTVLLAALTTSLSKRTDEVPKCVVAIKKWAKKKPKAANDYGVCADGGGDKQSHPITWYCISRTIDNIFSWLLFLVLAAGTLLYFCVSSQAK